MKNDVVIIVVGVALLAVVWIGWDRFQALRGVEPDRGNIACTLEAKLCPDGSYVGRVPPTCEFTQCPQPRGQNGPTRPGLNEQEPVFCTADAMQCPDGTWVGRTGPNCEFVCPGAR